MKRRGSKRIAGRVLSLFLAILMVCTLVPLNVLAEEPAALKTDKEVYTKGEPVLVTANTDEPGAWVGIYGAEDNPAGTTSYYWYYVDGNEGTLSWENGKTYNIYDGVCNNRDGYNGNRGLYAGEYKVVLFDGGSNVIEEIEIEIKDPESTETSLETLKTVYESGEKIQLKATAYGWGDWVAVFSGTYDADHAFGNDYIAWYYTLGRNGAWVEIAALAEGDYTAVLYENEGTSIQNAVHFSVEAPEEELLTTDKDEYAFGEAILVSTTYSGSDKDWIGIYKKGETFDPSKDGALSIHWYYVSSHEGEAVDITDASKMYQPTNNRTEAFLDGKLKSGEYTISLFSNDSYSSLATVDITIKTSVYGEPEVTPAACGSAGNIRTYYTDGTYTDEALPALSHVWSDWVYDGETAKTHTRTCSASAHAPETQECSFGEEPIEKVDATETADGYEIYQCTVCEGTYTNVLTQKEPIRVERVEPTCEAPGYVRSYYEGESGEYYLETVLEQLAHEYGDWEQTSENAKTHSKTCATDTNHTHVLTEACTLVVYSMTDGVTEYRCSVCEGSYRAPFIVTDKTEYEPGEPIMVTTNYYTDGAWVGLYRQGEKYDPNAGGSFSIYWYYVDNTVDQTVNILDTRDENGRTMGEGAYKVVLFSDSGYSALKEIEIQVGEEEGGGEDPEPTGTLTTNKTNYEVGEDILVTAECGANQSWVGIYRKGESPDPDNGGVVSLYWFYVVNGAVNLSGREVNLLSSEYFNTDRNEGVSNGEYTVILFGDGGYNNILDSVDITVFTDTSNTVYSISLNGNEMTAGQQAKFPENTEIILKASAENGNPGAAWVGVYANKYSAEMNFSTVSSNYWHNIADKNGEDVKLNDEMTLAAGDYTVVIFGDQAYSDIRLLVNFAISREGETSIIVKQPTCTKWGTEYVKYKDGTEQYLPIEPLGHAFEEKPVYDAAERKHTAYCTRCLAEAAEACTFDEGVVTTPATETATGTMTYTCEICGGTYDEEIPMLETEDVATGRIFGATRYETAIGIAEELKELKGISAFEAIIVAYGQNFPDAVSASYLAAVRNAPILLANASNASVINAYILENLAAGGTLYIMGGSTLVPDSIANGIPKENVKRIWGAKRYDTNLEALKEAGVTGGEILVCTGELFPDCLSASAAKLPILIVGNALTQAQKDYLASLDSASFILIGGSGAVNYTVESELRAYGSTERVYGADRYATAAAVAERFFDGPRAIVFAYGSDFPDALCGGTLAMQINAPLFLTQNGREAAAAEYAASEKINYAYVLGGETLISDAALEKIWGK